MNKRSLIALIIIGLLGLVALLVLKTYATDLVHIAVVNSVVQKAPDSYPAERIRQAFRRNYLAAERDGAEDAYLEKLKRLSQRLEKIQYLEEREVDEILKELQSN